MLLTFPYNQKQMTEAANLPLKTVHSHTEATDGNFCNSSVLITFPDFSITFRGLYMPLNFLWQVSSCSWFVFLCFCDQIQGDVTIIPNFKIGSLK